jgi:hypothetical protein
VADFKPDARELGIESRVEKGETAHTLEADKKQ